jgi:hypothetical protein
MNEKWPNDIDLSPSDRGWMTHAIVIQAYVLMTKEEWKRI